MHNPSPNGMCCSFPPRPEIRDSSPLPGCGSNIFPHNCRVDNLGRDDSTGASCLLLRCFGCGWRIHGNWSNVPGSHLFGGCGRVGDWIPGGTSFRFGVGSYFCHFRLLYAHDSGFRWVESECFPKLIGFESDGSSFCSGANTPFDGMPYLAQLIYSTSPVAEPIKGLRSIATRGWGISHPKVWPAFAVPIIYILLLLLLSVIVIRIRNRK